MAEATLPNGSRLPLSQPAVDRSLAHEDREYVKGVTPRSIKERQERAATTLAAPRERSPVDTFAAEHGERRTLERTPQ